MGFLSGIFQSSRLNNPANLSILKCDIHSHFIPGIDDGAETMEQSVELIKEFHALGYKKVITTPHILTDGYPNTPKIILEGLEKLKVALKSNNITMQVEAAAEYYLDFDFERKLKQEKLLTFGRNYLLFEVSYINAPDNLEHIIFQLQTNGYKPVLAHPERYPFWMEDLKKYEQLKEKGVLFQLNINSLAGYYGNDSKKTAELLIEKNMIEFLGSDCHKIKHVQIIKENSLFQKWLQRLLDSGKLLNDTL